MKNVYIYRYVVWAFGSCTMDFYADAVYSYKTKKYRKALSHK